MLKATFRKSEFCRESERHRVEQILHLSAEFLPCRVVDLGSGSGLIGMQLKGIGAEVAVIDISSRRIPAECRPFFVKADATTFPLADFDLIVCAGLLYHLNLSSQITLAGNMAGKPVILDTHFSRKPDVIRGAFRGQFRRPTRSTKTNRPFVHSIESLSNLFPNHQVEQPFDRLSADRMVFMLRPR